ncbi:uncharacterized protein LOC133824707 [Humulus lupulus]|uniref:uncharacterized protein LOC133824707 n=1 Tax=Humulus lupulus TaxID=3486 RepID=UPI002B409EC0|nr:uncharacterized protein LOC133824707 [Humulus lupulus]
MQTVCERCGVSHPFEHCMAAEVNNSIHMEQVNMLGSYNRQANNPFSNTYNPGWRTHPIFSWRNNQGPQQQSQQPMSQAPSQEMSQPPVSQEKANELQAALLTLTNTQTQFMTENRASTRNLDSQIGQLASMLDNWPQGTLPSNTVVNPKEQCNAISLRSGNELEELVKKSILLPKVADDKKNKVEEKVNENLEKKQSPVKALEQMPSYVKFMKEILLKKRKLEDYETVALTEECSAVLQKKLHPKLKDPARPTTVSLQMVDLSVKHPHGVIEDVLVKVDKVIFPADFIILDMVEDENIMIILGRPFLAIGRALIDVQKGEVKLVDVVNNEGDKLQITKKKLMVEGGMRKNHHRVKRIISEKA